MRLLTIAIVLSMTIQLASGLVFAGENDTSFLSYSDEFVYEVSENIQSKWNNHMVVEYMIKNKGENEITNWNFLVDIPYEIENIWNAQKIENDGSYYQIGNMGWNSSIQPGKSVSFGMTLSGVKDGSNIESPKTWILNFAQKAVDADDLTVSYTEYSNWGSGFNGVLRITNNSNSDINDWCFDVTANRPITSVSNAVLTDNGGSSYTLANAGYNASLKAHSSVDININGGSNDKTQFAVSIIKATSSSAAFSLSDDKDNDGVPDYQEFIAEKLHDTPEVTPTPTVTSTPVPTVEPTSTPEPTVEPTSTPEPTVEPTSTPEPTVEPTSTPEPTVEPTITPEPTVEPTSTPEPTVEPTSTPEPTVVPTSTPEPTVTSTPTPTPVVEDVDSDFDGLSDADEIVWGTDALNPDTDGDTLLDGDEVRMGKNPNDPSDKDLKVEQTLSVNINNDEDQAVTGITVTMNLAYPIEKVLTIKDVYTTDWYTRDLYSRLGSPVSFTCSEEFDTAKVVFHYAEGVLDETPEDDLGILWYDEENCCYIEQEQAVIDKEADTVSMEVSHFSTYAMHDKTKWKKLKFPGSKDFYYVHCEDTYSIVKGQTLDMDKAEQWVFFWYWLTDDVKKVKTLSRSAKFKEYWGYEEVYLIICDWLVFNKYDDDENGIYDFMEDGTGYMASNGHIYTDTSPFDITFVSWGDDHSIHVTKGVPDGTTETYPDGSIPEGTDDSWINEYVEHLVEGITTGILKLKKDHESSTDRYYQIESKNAGGLDKKYTFYYCDKDGRRDLYTADNMTVLATHLTDHWGYEDLYDQYLRYTRDELYFDDTQAESFDFDGDGIPDYKEKGNSIKYSNGEVVRYCILKDVNTTKIEIYVNYIDDANLVKELSGSKEFGEFQTGEYKVLFGEDAQRKELNYYVTYISIDRSKADTLDIDLDGIPDYVDPKIQEKNSVDKALIDSYDFDGDGIPDRDESIKSIIYPNGDIVRYCVWDRDNGDEIDIYVSYIDDVNLVKKLDSYDDYIDFLTGDYKVLSDADAVQRELNSEVTFISIDRSKAETLDIDHDGLPDYVDPEVRKRAKDGEVYRSVHAKSGITGNISNADVLFICDLTGESFEDHDSFAKELRNNNVSAYALKNLTIIDYMTILDEAKTCVFVSHGEFSSLSTSSLINTHIYIDNYYDHDLLDWYCTQKGWMDPTALDNIGRLYSLSLTNKFFEEFYGKGNSHNNNDFSNTVILSETCHFFGNGTSSPRCSLLAETLYEDCGSPFIMGFECSVGRDYAFEFITTMIEKYYYETDDWVEAYNETGLIVGFTNDESDKYGSWISTAKIYPES